MNEKVASTLLKSIEFSIDDAIITISRLSQFRVTLGIYEKETCDGEETPVEQISCFSTVWNSMKSVIKKMTDDVYNETNILRKNFLQVGCDVSDCVSQTETIVDDQVSEINAAMNDLLMAVSALEQFYNNVMSSPIVSENSETNVIVENLCFQKLWQGLPHFFKIVSKRIEAVVVGIENCIYNENLPEDTGKPDVRKPHN